MLGRVDVDIDIASSKLDKQRQHRVASPFENIAVPLHDGVLDYLVPDITTVNIRIDASGAGSAGCRGAQKALQANAVPRHIQRTELFGKLRAEQLPCPC